MKQKTAAEGSIRKACCGCHGCLLFISYTGVRAEGGARPPEKTPEETGAANGNEATESWRVTTVLRQVPWGGKPILHTRNDSASLDTGLHKNTTAES